MNYIDKIEEEHGIEYVFEASDTEIPMTPEEFRQACGEAVAKGIPIVFRNLAPKNVHPEWDAHLAHLNFQLHNRAGLNNGEKVIPGFPQRERAINNTTISGLFYIVNAITDPDVWFPSMKPFTKFLNAAVGEEDGDPAPNMHFMSFIAGDAIADAHRDPQHTVYVQNQGSVQWRFYDENAICHKCEMPRFYRNVDQGDVVFIPQAVSHSVDFVSPRAAIAYRSHNTEWENLPVVAKEQFGWEDGGPDGNYRN
jgi:hypothetical protein